MESRPTTAAYADRLLGLLGERDPLEVLAAQPARLRELVDGVDEELLSTPEAPGKWSAKDVVVHLVDSEVVYGYRMRFVVAQPGHALAGYDQDRWVAALRYGEAPLDLALDLFDVLRRWNLVWVGGLNGEELERHGDHEERGRESVGRIVRLLAAHDLAHDRQIERILGRVRAG